MTRQDPAPEVELSGIGVRLYGSMGALADQILPPNEPLHHGFAVAINPEKIIKMRQDPETRAALVSATIRYADGAGVVWALRRRGIDATRITGADLWERLMGRAAVRGVPVFLWGARPEVLEETVARLRATLPTIRIGAALHGYASEAEADTFRSAIRDAGTGIVAVAMGSPLQEKVICRLRQACPDAFYMGVGGTFDCYTGVVQRAPLAWQERDAEWLYRLLCQPSRIKRQWKLLPYAALVLAGRV
ncbi:MAG: UDP-N-acetyl-D-mannosaminouronate:lipid I N-acetyl-D-mannosaminouronosyltransferase [Myxococcota bacterium]|jgi:UDP-N-acetyl-D-mannosaminouronate:lipid I N-acetyl-D-mannosaminouronosyltransferase